ncbi:hypothetical protein Trydic_g4295 [Trypoxylus dichotomus]
MRVIRPPNAPRAKTHRRGVLRASARIRPTTKVAPNRRTRRRGKFCPATQEGSAQTSAATHPTKIGGPEGLGPSSGKGLHTDGGQPPAAVHQHAAAVRKGTTKTVKTAKTETRLIQIPTKPTPAIVDEVADYDTSETTSRPEANVFDTFSQLIPLIQKINRQKLLQVAASLLPKLLKCRSIPEVGLLLAGHLEDIPAIFSHNE